MKRRLIIRQGGIGDCIMCLPAMRHLAKDYETEVWLPPPVVPLLSKEFKTVALTGTGIYSLQNPEAQRSLIHRLASFDSIISWYNNEAFIKFCFGKFDITRFEPLPLVGVPMHMSDWFSWQTGCTERIPTLEVARLPVRDVVLIHPFSGSYVKNYSMEFFETVAAGLNPIPCEWVAGPEQPIERDVIRIENLYELAVYLTSVKLYIGNDSGITHLAAALGVPVIALFTNSSNMAQWMPKGRGHVSAIRTSSSNYVTALAREIFENGANYRSGDIPSGSDYQAQSNAC